MSPENESYLGELEEFLILVSQLRETQKLFFRTKDRTVLRHAFKLEKSVDETIKKYEQLIKFGPNPEDT